MAKKKLLILAITLACTASAQAVTIDTVPVGDPGNPADVRYDPDGIGAVPSAFRMGKFEVTNAQYVEFLNAVAALDSFGLYHSSMGNTSVGGIIRSGASGSYSYAVKPPAIGQGPNGADYGYDDKPVAFISWYRAIRFANWLHNGQGSGDTETGTYTLLGPYDLIGETAVPSNASSITRNLGARWFLPNKDEWHKSAYYDPTADMYFEFSMGSDMEPSHNLPANDNGNSANFSQATGNLNYPLTDVGAYTQSDSPFGTFDQGGNVSEWNESLRQVTLFDLTAGIRGGAWNESSFGLSASAYADDAPEIEESHIGFRVATVIPEPSTLVLLGIGMLLLGHRRLR